MTRLAATVDRLAALIAGIAFLALGAGMVVWNTTWVPNIPRTLTRARTERSHDYRMVAVGALGRRCRSGRSGNALAADLHPVARVKSLPLHTSDTGTITIDLGDVASAAGQALEQSIDVESANGKSVIDRGTRTVDLTVHVAPTTVRIKSPHLSTLRARRSPPCWPTPPSPPADHPRRQEARPRLPRPLKFTRYRQHSLGSEVVDGSEQVCVTV